VRVLCWNSYAYFTMIDASYPESCEKNKEVSIKKTKDKNINNNTI